MDIRPTEVMTSKVFFFVVFIKRVLSHPEQRMLDQGLPLKKTKAAPVRPGSAAERFGRRTLHDALALHEGCALSHYGTSSVVLSLMEVEAVHVRHFVDVG